MIYATNGAKLYIGGVFNMQAEDVEASDFTGQSAEWKEIKELEALGSLGDTAAEIGVDLIGEGRSKRLKGTRNAGTMELVCAINYADEGQLALLAAEKTIHNYAFRLVLNDAPPGGTPSERLFIAAVGSASEAFDTANSVMKLNASLWVNSNVARINASA